MQDIRITIKHLKVFVVPGCRESWWGGAPEGARAERLAVALSKGPGQGRISYSSRQKPAECSLCACGTHGHGGLPLWYPPKTPCKSGLCPLESLKTTPGLSLGKDGETCLINPPWDKVEAVSGDPETRLCGCVSQC